MSYHSTSLFASVDGGIGRSLRELLERTTDCVFMLSDAWRFTYVSPGASVEIAEGGNSLVGRTLWDVFPESAETSFELNCRRVMKDRAETQFEAYFPPLAAWYQVHAVPLLGGGIGVCFWNINNRVARIQALALAKERFRLVTRATQDVAFDWDLTSDKCDWLETHNKSLGRPPERLRTDASWWLGYTHPEDRLRVRRELQQTIDGNGCHFECEFRLMKVDGSYADVLVKALIARDHLGSATRMVGAIQDNTERTSSARALKDRETRLTNIFGQAMVGIMHGGRDRKFLMANERFCQMVGRTEDELRELTFLDYTHPDDVESSKRLYEQKAKTAESFQVEKRYLHSDGSVVWCEVHVNFLRTKGGQPDGTIVVAQDISARKVAEESLRESEMLYRSVLEASADCIEIMNLDGTLHLLNSQALAARNFTSAGEASGKLWADFWPKASRKDVDAAFASAREGKSARFSAYSGSPCETPRWWDVMVSAMCSNEGQVTRILAIARDTTHQRETEAQLKWTSEHDPLTELPNRRAFETRLKAAIIRAMESDGNVGLLLIDLDHFKHVNDTLGHTAGDHLLAIIARRLKKILRKGDFVGRLGGDEFAVILEHGEGDIDLAGTGRAILSRLRKPVCYEGRVISASASIGGAVWPIDANNANDLFDNADIALYELKAHGRGGTKMYEGQMRDRAQIVSSQLSLARVSVTDDSVEPYYQQKVDLRTGEIVGFEALLRWRHAVLGIQNPDTVAEAFKDYELASKISDLMQEKVFRDVRGWLNRNLPFGLVSINAAPVEFLRDDFAERTISRIKNHQIDPKLVELEVTEHVFLESSSDYVGRALRKLAQEGVRIALDDFGTGYSSLSHLRDFPVDVVKIDRSFIERIVFDPEIMAIVSAVIDLSRSLNMKVVAEGVETREQMNLLRDEGCPFGQGYFFGKPVDAAQVPRLLRASRGPPQKPA